MISLIMNWKVKIYLHLNFIKMRAFFRRVINKKIPFNFQGIVYLDDNNKPVEGEITDKVRWKDKIVVYSYSEKDATKHAMELFNFKYPNLKGKIWLM